MTVPPDLRLSPALLAALGLLGCAEGGKADVCLTLVEETDSDESDSDVGPCLETDPEVDTDTDSDVGPCLDFPPETDTSPCLEIDTDTDLGPCLDFVPDTDDSDTDDSDTDDSDTDDSDTVVTPCLSPPLETDSDSDETDLESDVETDSPTDTFGPCLDTAAAGGTGDTDTFGPCLDTFRRQESDTGVAPDTESPDTDTPVDTDLPVPESGDTGRATTSTVPVRAGLLAGGEARAQARADVLARGVLPDDLAAVLERVRRKG